MELTKTEVMELQRLASARTGRADSARLARLLLLMSEGLTWAEISHQARLQRQLHRSLEQAVYSRASWNAFPSSDV
jgi:hypothetical protein